MKYQSRFPHPQWDTSFDTSEFAGVEFAQHSRLIEDERISILQKAPASVTSNKFRAHTKLTTKHLSRRERCPKIMAKRRRSSSALSSDRARLSSRVAELPPDSINPLSYRPATLRQLAVAGLPETEPLPSRLIHLFPHRPLPGADGNGGSEDKEREEDGLSSENESGRQQDAKPSRRADSAPPPRRYHYRPNAPPRRHVAALAAVAERSLADGNVARARRAFGLLVRAGVYGRAVDLREGGLWALGAEILMRGGAGGTEEDEKFARIVEATAPGEGMGEGKRRWGSASHMAAVREYFDRLITLHPYIRQHPGAVSALDFWPALLGCEVYNVHAEHKLALRGLEEKEKETEEEVAEEASTEEGWEDDHRGLMMDYEDDGEDDGSNAEISSNQRLRREREPTGRAERLRTEKSRIRAATLSEMRDIARRMDALMENIPYSTSPELLRLRGVVALYMGDLARSSSLDGEEEGQVWRENEAERARRMFRKMVEHGGEADPWIARFLEGGRVKEEQDDEDDEDEDMAEASFDMFSSPLPIRRHQI